MQLLDPDNLACPLCGEALVQMERRLVCSSGHSFDEARQGYANLLPVQHKKSREPGDSKAMVAARRAFLDRGVYEPVARELVNQCRTHWLATASGHQRIVDAGCGEGYYLDYLIKALQAPGSGPEETLSAIGLDISKDAIVAATRRNRALCWIVGTNVHPPVAAGSLDCLLCLFGFPSFEHFKTLLRDDGVIILVDPGPDHLIELRELIYSEVRRSPVPGLTVASGQGLRQKHSTTLRYRTGELEQAQIQNLLAMTPHLYRASREGKLAAAGIESMAMTVEVVFRVLGRMEK